MEVGRRPAQHEQVLHTHSVPLCARSRAPYRCAGAPRCSARPLTRTRVALPREVVAGRRVGSAVPYLSARACKDTTPHSAEPDARARAENPRSPRRLSGARGVRNKRVRNKRVFG